MKLSRLTGEFFRNITHFDLTFSPDFNIIYGYNGSGKTSILEMIYCISRGRSFRTRASAPIIQYGSSYCTVFGLSISDSISMSVGFKKTLDGKTQLKVGHEKKPPSANALAQLLPLQLFSPSYQEFLSQGPRIRRKFIDWGVFYLEANFVDSWSRYNQLLKQRNAALIQKQPITQIALWHAEMARVGEYLFQVRDHYIQQLTQVAQYFIHRLVGAITIEFKHYRGWETQYSLLESLNHFVKKDFQYGYTSCGPHRCDLIIRVNGLEIEDTLSRGEQKRLILSLYLAQGQLLKQSTGKTCIYLIDDVLSELDAYYQLKVLEVLKELESQVFITVLDKKVVEQVHAISQSHIFHMSEGVLQA